MDREAMFLAAKGAFLFGAVFMLGLMAGGLLYSRGAFLFGLGAAGASYLAQVAEAYSQAGPLRWAMGALWLAAVGLSLLGCLLLIGG